MIATTILALAFAASVQVFAEAWSMRGRVWAALNRQPQSTFAGEI